MQLQKSGFSFLSDPRKDSLRDISRPSDEFAKNDLYLPYNLELLSLKHFLAHWRNKCNVIAREISWEILIYMDLYSLEKEMATHSSTLAWRIPWTKELGGLQSTGRKELDTTEWLHFTSLSLYSLESWHFHHDIVSFCSYFEPDGFGLSRDFCIMDHHFFQLGQ